MTPNLLTDEMIEHLRGCPWEVRNFVDDLLAELADERRKSDVAIRTARASAEAMAPHIEKIKGIQLHNKFAHHAAQLEEVVDSARHFCQMAPPWGHAEGPERLAKLRKALAAIGRWP